MRALSKYEGSLRDVGFGEITNYYVRKTNLFQMRGLGKHVFPGTVLADITFSL